MKTAINAAWLTVTRLTADILSFFLFVAISRHFGPAGTGAYAYGFAVAGLISVCGTIGLDDYGIREYARLNQAGRRPLVTNLLSTQAVMISLAAIGLAIYLVATHPARETALVILLLATHLLALAIARVLFVPAFAQQAMVGPAFAELVCRGGAVLVALLMVVVFRSSLVSALAVFPLAGLLFLAAAAASAVRHGAVLRLRISLAAARATVRAAWPFAASEVVFQVYARAGLVILALVAGDAAAGIYTSGFKFVEVGMMPLVFVGVAAYPRLSHSFEHDPQGFAAFGANLLRAALFLGGLLAWGLYFVVPPLIVPLFGSRFIEAVAVVRVMAALALVSAAEVVLVRVLLASHLQVTRLRLLVLGTGLNIALNLLLIPLFRIWGAAAAWIGTLAILDALYGHALRGRLGPRGLSATFMGYAATVGLALASALLIARLPLPPWVPAIASLVIYFGAAAVTRLLPSLRLAVLPRFMTLPAQAGGDGIEP
jgi:O-antigen/teichoic acid export membrane protein